MLLPYSVETKILVPIFKKGAWCIISKYRPISLLPVISKALVRLLAMQLTKFLEQNKIISSVQHGFRRYHLCESAALILSKRIFTNWQKWSQFAYMCNWLLKSIWMYSTPHSSSSVISNWLKHEMHWVIFIVSLWSYTVHKICWCSVWSFTRCPWSVTGWRFGTPAI